MIPVKNCVLYKTPVGQVRASYHKLPPSDFVYGKFTKKDGIGAGEMIKNWRYHQSSISPKKEDSYILSNSLSVANGLSKGPDFTKFRKNVHQKLKIKSNNSASLTKIPDIVHGVPLRPSTPMQAVMTNFYGNLAQKIFEDKIEKSQEKPSKNPNFSIKPKILKISNSKPEFKLKKFSKIPSKAKCWADISQC